MSEREVGRRPPPRSYEREVTEMVKDEWHKTNEEYDIRDYGILTFVMREWQWTEWLRQRQRDAEEVDSET